MIGKDQIEHRFGFHKVLVESENGRGSPHRDLRMEFREFAEWLDEMLPEGRAKSMAFDELETASMWAHKAIAQNTPLVEEK